MTRERSSSTKNENLSIKLENILKSFKKNLKKTQRKLGDFFNREEDSLMKKFKKFIEYVSKVMILKRFIKKLQWKAGLRNVSSISKREILLVNDISYFDQIRLFKKEIKEKVTNYRNLHLYFSNFFYL